MAKKTINYFDEFTKLIGLSKKSAEKLYELLNDYSKENIKPYSDAIHFWEHEGDLALHSIMFEINRSSPSHHMDREDIAQLVSELDDINDSIESVVDLLNILSIKKLRPEVVRMAGLVRDACGALYEAVREFARFKSSNNFLDHTMKVNKIEEEGDRLHHELVQNLFRDEKDAVEIMKWQQIFDTLEEVLNNCEDVADMLDGLAVKNS